MTRNDISRRIEDELLNGGTAAAYPADFGYCQNRARAALNNAAKKLGLKIKTRKREDAGSPVTIFGYVLR